MPTCIGCQPTYPVSCDNPDIGTCAGPLTGADEARIGDETEALPEPLLRRPMVMCTYPMPSGASDQATRAQLPRLRVTVRAVPRAA